MRAQDEAKRGAVGAYTVDELVCAWPLSSARLTELGLFAVCAALDAAALAPSDAVAAPAPTLSALLPLVPPMAAALAVRRGEPTAAAAGGVAPASSLADRLRARWLMPAPLPAALASCPPVLAAACSVAGRRCTKRLMAPPKSADRMATSWFTAAVADSGMNSVTVVMASCPG